MARFTPALAALLVLSAAPAFAADGDAAAGKKVFNQCRACHTINEGGRSGVGPNLHGIVGRVAGSIDGFRYSKAMQEKHAEGYQWTEEHLRAYIQDPKGTIPGNAMAFAGIKKEDQLNNLLAYLKNPD